MDIKLSSIIFAVANFLILFFVLKKFFFNKVESFIEHRQNEIEGLYKEIEENKSMIEEKKEQIEQEVKELREKGENVFDNFKKSGEKKKNQLILQGKDEAEAIVHKAYGQIKNEKKEAQKEIINVALDLSIFLCEKALKDTLDEKMQKEILKQCIHKIGKENA